MAASHCQFRAACVTVNVSFTTYLCSLPCLLPWAAFLLRENPCIIGDPRYEHLGKKMLRGKKKTSTYFLRRDCDNPRATITLRAFILPFFMKLTIVRNKKREVSCHGRWSHSNLQFVSSFVISLLTGTVFTQIRFVLVKFIRLQHGDKWLKSWRERQLARDRVLIWFSDTPHGSGDTAWFSL